MNLELGKCPKCGADYISKVEWGGRKDDYWACGSSRTPDGRLNESKRCLRRQLTQAKQNNATP